MIRVSLSPVWLDLDDRDHVILRQVVHGWVDHGLILLQRRLVVVSPDNYVGAQDQKDVDKDEHSGTAGQAASKHGAEVLLLLERHTGRWTKLVPILKKLLHFVLCDSKIIITNFFYLMI